MSFKIQSREGNYFQISEKYSIEIEWIHGIEVFFFAKFQHLTYGIDFKFYNKSTLLPFLK